MPLTDSQRTELVDKQWANSDLGQRIDRGRAASREEVRRDVEAPDLSQYYIDRDPVLDAPEDVKSDKPRTIELTDSEDDFLPFIDRTNQLQLDDVNDSFDLKEQAFNQKVTGETIPEGDIQFKFLKPLKKTVRGFDIATGRRVLDRGDSTNDVAMESYMEGIDLIRKGSYNPEFGLDENGLRGITRVADGIIEEGLDKKEFERAIDMIGVPKEQAKLAWATANNVRIERDLEDYLGTDFDIETELPSPAPMEDLSRNDLPSVPRWAEAARTVYEIDNGQPFQGDDEELIDWYINEMSNFNWKITQIPGVNTSSMAAYVRRAMVNGQEYAQALTDLIDIYDRVETDWGIVGNNVQALFGDPTTYIGLGGGTLAIQAAKRVAKERMGKILTTAIAGYGAGTLEGGAYGAAHEAGRQSVEVSGGDRESIDKGQVAKQGAITAAIAGPLGAGAAVAIPAVVRGGQKVGRRMMENARRAPQRGPVYRQIGAVGDLSKLDLKWGDHPGLRNAFAMADAKTYKKGRELKSDLQALARAVAARNGVDLSQDTPEANAVLADLLTQDAKVALISNSNAVGWYDKTVGAALEVLSLIHPELKTDPSKEFAFKAILAITSNGLKVDLNFRKAEEAYAKYKATGRFPTDVTAGQAAPAMVDAFNNMNGWVDDIGWEGLGKFMMERWTVRQLKRMGFETSGELIDQEILGASIIGPKIGNGFFSNLYGNFDQLTIDRWFMATWGRHTGTLLDEKPELVARNKKDLSDAIRNLKAENPDAVKAFAQMGVNLRSGDPIGTGEQIAKASMLPANRVIMNQTPLGESIRLLGNNLTKNADAQKLSPTPQDRARIRKVMTSVLSEMKRDNPDMTMADLQALLWYPEKRLYDKARSKNEVSEGYDDDGAPDYANAAMDLARRVGVDEKTVQEAAENGRQRGTRQAQLADAEGSQQESGRGFTPRERAETLRRDLYAQNRPGRTGSGKARAYSGRSGGADQRVRGVKQVFTPSKSYQTLARDSEIPAVEMHELDASRTADFHSAITQSASNSRYGAAVYTYTPEEYADMRLFLSPDGVNGFAIKPDGDLVSVFSGGGGNVYSMVQLAVEQGATKLDAFDTVLPEIYEIAGFKAYRKEKWDDAMWDESVWDKSVFKKFNNGEPDIVYMEYDPNHVPGSEHPNKKVTEKAGVMLGDTGRLRRDKARLEDAKASLAAQKGEEDGND